MSKMREECEERVEELEAEIAALKAEQIDMLLHPEKYFSCYRDLKVVAAENAALRAEFDHAVSINNPCHHTGLESFVCEDCGYPDPRKIIAALKAERDRMKAALTGIANTSCGKPCDWYSNDCAQCMMETARKALRGGEGKKFIEIHDTTPKSLISRQKESGPGEDQKMYICVSCKREMRCDKNGVGANYGNGHVYIADRYECPKCGLMILATNHNPVHDPNLNFCREYLNMPQKEY